MTRYYDIILGSIPIVLFGIPGFFHLVGHQLTAGILIGGLGAAGLVGHALFIKSPTEPKPASPSVNDHQTANTSEQPAPATSD